MGGRGSACNCRACRSIGMLLVFAAGLTEAQAQTRSPQPTGSTACRSEPTGEGTVSTVVDGRSFVLTDGREIRLAAIEVPFYYRPGQPGSDAGHAARAKLESILAGATVALSRAQPGSDRYERTLAYVDVINEGMRRP